MIWGSQYDAMLNWALTGNEAYMVFERTGNHSGSVAKTGRYGSDIINNIFDLCANFADITQEGRNSDRRTSRGNAYGVNGSNSINSRTHCVSNYPNLAIGSRLSLYIRTSN